MARDRQPTLIVYGVPVGTNPGLAGDQVKILRKSRNNNSIGDLMVLVGRTNRIKFRDQVLGPQLSAGPIVMTVPDKPNSRLQKYRFTKKGLAYLRCFP